MDVNSRKYYGKTQLFVLNPNLFTTGSKLGQNTKEPQISQQPQKLAL